ncbi:MAG: hypothetical protein HY319_05215, partial [Armatimonadetes bacterium]|nr:hypothetical protein [Armatimonadota bacterium]
MSAGLTIEADLQVSLDGEPVEVEAQGASITINVASLSTLQKMFRFWRSQGGQLEQLQVLDRVLKHGGLSLSFQAGGKTLARLGSGEKSGLNRFLSRVLG